MNLGLIIAKFRALSHSEGLARVAKTLIVGGGGSILPVDDYDPALVVLAGCRVIDVVG